MTKYLGDIKSGVSSQGFMGINPKYLVIAKYSGISKKISS
jgi:hypothetical protein